MQGPHHGIEVVLWIALVVIAIVALVGGYGVFWWTEDGVFGLLTTLLLGCVGVGLLRGDVHRFIDWLRR